MIQSQKSHVTLYNRYPEIFTECMKHTTIIHKNPKILSFGCSSGLECETLSNIYFKESQITGLDISALVITENNKKNKNDKIKYFCNIDKLFLNDININGKYDIIFALSVLCSYPEETEIYTYTTFMDTIKLLDELLNINGHLVIYNSKYLFTDTDISKKYIIIDTEYKNTGFVKKYTKDNDVEVKTYTHYLFKKIS